MNIHHLLRRGILHVSLLGTVVFLAQTGAGQTLLNLDFGAAAGGPKSGFAATGLSTNDLWNAYRHYEPKFEPGMQLVPNGRLEKLKLADGKETAVAISVQNAPGVWGNSCGDPMYDTYMFAQNGSNIVVTLTGLPPARYHFYLYGHADADVTGEQNSVFTLKAGTNSVGPLAQTGGAGWKAGAWQERAQYVVFRDVEVGSEPVTIEVAPGPNGVAVLNGLQIISRGTSPPKLATTHRSLPDTSSTNLVIREIRYDGVVSDSEARFGVTLEVEALSTNECSAELFEGEAAVLAMDLPAGLRIINRGNQSRLVCTAPGAHSVRLDLLVKITRSEAWEQIALTGPPAGIASLNVRAASPGVELQLLSGALIHDAVKQEQATTPASLEGFLGADRLLSLRWQSKGAEIARKPLVIVDTLGSVQISPGVLKFTTAFQFGIVQGVLPRMAIELPTNQTLTRIEGEQIRDWQVKTDSGRQVLQVEFLKPIEKAITLTVLSEQAVDANGAEFTLSPPQPLEVEHESGSFTLNLDETIAELVSTAGLRQVNASQGAFAAYRFNTRPASVLAKLRRIEPLVTASDRITARVEETRFVVLHEVQVRIEKAGIYSLDFRPPPGFEITEVKGDSIEDWKSTSGRLAISFASKALGVRNLQIQLERPQHEFPAEFAVEPLTLAGVTNINVQLGVGAVPGIQLKTTDTSGLRELPITLLANHADETLAFGNRSAEWKLALAAEKRPPRVVAEVFNLVTIGDGVVGGSATIRYGIINQGVQQFRISLPPTWKNIEFTGSGIRRKEQETNVWTITLQDKAWGGYTMVVTYDYGFDPKGGTLALAGAHTLDVERESGSLGVMTAANLKLTPGATREPLHRVDETELAASDRALCTRPLLLAYKYTGNEFHQPLEVARFEDVQVLDAVADRTELTSVVTEEGQLLTQSSFMVKNNEKQFQRFKLPKDSEFWSSLVNGQPAKPERDGDWLLIPLPHDANRDEAFAVDIVYAQKVNLKSMVFPRHLELAAPLTDIPNTYAEWQLFAPISKRVSGFGGNMTVAAGTTYTLHDAWTRFVVFYGDLMENHWNTVIGGCLVLLLLVLVVSAVRKGVPGVLAVLFVVAVMAILASMMLPALSRAKSKSHSLTAINNLRQIGLAAKTWAMDNNDVLPPNFEAMSSELGSMSLTTDPSTGQRFIWNGAGKPAESRDAVVAYSPSDANGRAVLLGDGSVRMMKADEFQVALSRDSTIERNLFSANAPAAKAEPAERAAARMAGEAIRQSVPQALADLNRNSRNDMWVQQAAAASAAGTFGVRPLSAAESAAITRSAEPPAPATGSPGIAFANSTVTSGIGGGGGGGGGAATVRGVHPLRIEIPRAGQAFTFTKALNVQGEPLDIRLSIMSLKTYRALQMTLQLALFILGLVLFWAFSLAAPRFSFWRALAATMVLWSLTSLLLAWRVLHLGFIALAPLLGLGFLVYLGNRYFKQRRHNQPPDDSNNPPPSSASPEPSAPLETGPAVALLVLLMSICFGAQSRAAEAASLALPESISIVAADYSGTVGERVAELSGRIKIVTAETNQWVPLFGEDIAVESFNAPAEARLVRNAAGIGVLVGPRTNLVVEVKFAAKIRGDVSHRQLTCGLPLAISSRIGLELEEPEAEVECPSAISLVKSPQGQGTHVTLVLGPAGRLELGWTPRVKRAAEIAATVFVQNHSLASLGGGVVNLLSTFDYQVTQGELNRLRIQIPEGLRLLRVLGPSLRQWEINGDTLVIDLLKGVSPAYRLVVETETPELPASVELRVPHALDVKRENGFIGLKAAEELSVEVQNAAGLQRVDAEDFYRELPDKKEALVSAFRFSDKDFHLTLRAELVKPQLEAVVHTYALVGTESLHLSAQVDYTVKRSGLFSLRLLLPPDYRVEAVSGTNIGHWAEQEDVAAGRILEVSFASRAVGLGQLTVQLSQTYVEAPKMLSLDSVHPLGAEKLSGVITVSTELGLAAKTASLTGLTEIPFTGWGAAPARQGAEELPMASGGLSYKFVSNPPGAKPTWTLNISTETVEPWVRAEIVNTVTVSETLISGRAQVKFEIANAPARQFRLKVPNQFKNVEITGADLRRKEETNGLWRIETQGRVRGTYLLKVTWEQPKSAATNLLTLGGVEALDVERETGFLALVAHSPLQLSEKVTQGMLNKIDVRELPSWAGTPDAATVLAYQYLRPGYSLSVEARRFEEADVLQTLIEDTHFSTVLADDGQYMTEVALTVRNNGRQHLELDLPAGATVWSAFVAGEPVRPSRRNGKLLLPLARETASEETLAIELTFVGSAPFPKTKGTLSLISTIFDVPLKNAHWDLYLPPGFDYSDFSGTMTRATEVSAPVAQVYSLSQYNEQQQAQEEEMSFRRSYGLSEARQELTGGNLRAAVKSLNQAKSLGNKLPTGGAKDREVEQIEGELRKAQGSNLINAQNQYFYENAGRMEASQGQTDGVGFGFRFGGRSQTAMNSDPEVAALQWDKLNKAQEIAVAKVTPLRVNLPLRGVHYSFAQVLQTEPGKPMTIRLEARNTATPNWFRRLALGLVGFGCLWLLVAWMGKDSAHRLARA